LNCTLSNFEIPEVAHCLIFTKKLLSFGVYAAHKLQVPMGIFSRFKGSGLKPAWMYETPGVIWRVLFSETGHIIGEGRDTANKTVSFFCIDKETGQRAWDNLRLDEKWWIGIEATHRDVVYLHEYATPDMPIHKKIIAVNIQSGKTLWQNDMLTFLFAASRKVYAVRDTFERKLFFELDYLTGEITNEYGDDSAAVFAIRNARRETDESQGFVFPVPFSNELDDYAVLEPTIRKHCNPSTIRGDIEVIQRGNLFLFSYHQLVEKSAEPLVDNHFKIVDLSDSSVLFSETLTHNAPAAVPDSFFIKDNVLYFIKDKNILTAIKLEMK